MKPPNLTAAIFCLLLGLLALLFFVLPDSPFSVTEKRSLQTAPSFRLSDLFSGRLSAVVNDWYADQFPFREALIRVKCLAEYALGKGGNNGIHAGTDGQLARIDFDLNAAGRSISDTDRVPMEQILLSADGINRAAANARVPTVFLIPGRTVDILSDVLSYPSSAGDDLLDAWRGALTGQVIAPDVAAVLRERARAGEKVMFRTDHHWTALGAYYAYREVLRSFGMEDELLPAGDFRRVRVTGDFRGTFLCSGGFPWVSPEEIEVWYGADDGNYEVVADGVARTGFYAPPAEGMPVGYEVFLGGTHDVVTVRKKGAEGRPLLLLVRDSFADALAPFLARHFDLVLLNLSSSRTDFTDLTALAERYGADRVLVVWNVANLFFTDRAARFS